MSTDDQTEIFDVVDLDDQVIGRATRKECNSDPDLIHRAVFVLIYNDKGQLLWQKRSETKDTNPGRWVTSASGHVDVGEGYKETAVREVREELGVDVDVEFLGKFLFHYTNETEYSAIFRAHSNGPFDFNREEISEIRFMTIGEILKKEKEGTLQLAKAVHYIMESLSI